MYVFPQEDCSVEEGHENSNSVFLGQTNYRDKLGRDY